MTLPAHANASNRSMPGPTTPGPATPGLTWLQIVRLGLVQASLGSVVVLTTSTLNRVMVVELALAAAVPGALVGLHYAVQMLRPLWGHGSDVGASRTRWIVGGVALLALAGTMAAWSVGVMEASLPLGLVLAALAFALIGLGIGAAGTSLLALVAARTAAHRRPAAATLVWVLMIVGIVATAGTTGALLDPYSHGRLLLITASTGAIALALTVLATWGIERRSADLGAPTAAKPPFREALAEAWADGEARLFTLFVFVSMLAYSAQDLILEPFGGLVHGMSPGETTALAGTQHGGVLLGMVLVGTLGTWLARRRSGALRAIVIAGCTLSAVMLGGLALSADAPGTWPLSLNVFALGAANGAFAVAAIGSMFALAGSGPGGTARAGVRMGVWGAAQAVAFGLGGFMGAVAVDLVGLLTGEVAASYRTVFLAEGAVFLLAALVATRLRLGGAAPLPRLAPLVPDAEAAEIAYPARPPIRPPIRPLEAAE